MKITVITPGMGREKMPEGKCIGSQTSCLANNICYCEKWNEAHPWHIALDQQGNKLPPGEYDVELVWQYKCDPDCEYEWDGCLDNNPEHYIPHAETRQVYQLVILEHGDTPLSLCVFSNRDWQEDSNHENGNYVCKCQTCEQEFTGHKRRVTCKQCASTPQPNKGETVEEAVSIDKFANEWVVDKLKSHWCSEDEERVLTNDEIVEKFEDEYALAMDAYKAGHRAQFKMVK